MKKTRRLFSALIALMLLILPSTNVHASAPPVDIPLLPLEQGHTPQSAGIRPFALLSGTASVQRKGFGKLELYARVFNTAVETTLYWPTLQRKVNGVWQDYKAYPYTLDMFFTATTSAPMFSEYRLKVVASSGSIPSFTFYSDAVLNF